MNAEGMHGDDSTEALDYLPRKPLEAYPRSETIYSGWPESLYLVVSGRVTIYRKQPTGCDSLIRIVAVERLFGEICLAKPASPEHAFALDDVQLMSWKRNEILDRIQKEPRLGVALLKHALFASQEFQNRLQAVMNLPMRQRLISALLELADASGREQPGGLVRMGPIVHRLIAEFTGTSREMVTYHMNLLRRNGLLNYSRKEIAINPGAMLAEIRAYASEGGKPQQSSPMGVVARA